MKRLLFTLGLAVCTLLLPIQPAHAARTPGAATASNKPAIDTVRGRTVRVRVPAGLSSVTLERCTSARLATWEIVATKPTARTAGTVEFELPAAVSRRFLRVKGNAAPPAGSVLAGAHLFLADPTLLANGAFSPNNTVPRLSNSGVVTLNNTSSVSSTDSTATRTVSESDIWRVAGDRLYFFNELRGLQVFDIANPDDPALLGQLRLAANGEEMYLLDSTHVALLTEGTSFIRLGVANRIVGNTAIYNTNASSVVIADVTGGHPTVAATLEYRGYLRESRLVGSVLYVVAEVYGLGVNGSEPQSYQHGLEVTSFDLSNPAQPVKRDSLFLGNWGGVVTATDRFLFVVSYGDDWVHSLIDVIDISSPTGVLAKRGQIETAGIVNDKFKMHLDGNIFTAVSSVPRHWRDNAWINGVDPADASRTKVETFSLTNPNAPTKLGSLELGVGETVRATRFDDQRLYVVTFFQIDPLWVVNLADPAHPTLLGELEVPGFSNYILPLGDRLVAIGRVGSQTAVSLFDVSDPAHPAVLSQLPLGDGYSYSEANWTEKAFNVMPEENLIVVPYSSYDSGTGYAGRVQLIDLTRNALVKRGVVEHGFAARRTAVSGNRLLAISSSDLVTVNFSDRDHPIVTSDVEIAWRVDRVFLAGNFLVQIGGSAAWNSGKPQTLTVSTAADPETALGSVDLDPVSVVGATVRDGRLYVAQRGSPGYSTLIYAPNSGAATNTGGSTVANPFILSIFDLTSLPAIPLVSRTTFDAALGYWGSELTAVWPSPGVLVWVLQQQNYWGWWGGYINFGGIRPVDGIAPNVGGLILSNTAGLVKTGAGNVTLTGGTLTLNNTTTVSGGTLTVGGSTSTLTSNSSVTSTSNSFSVDFKDGGSGTNLVVVGSSTPAPAKPNPTVTAATRNASGSSSSTGVTISGSNSLIRIGYPWWGYANSGTEALVFDVSTPATPTLAAKLEIRTGSTGDWSEPFTAAGKLYVSSMAYEDFVTIGDTPATSVTAPSRRYRHFLKVVDLAVPTTPVIGAEVSIPGKLIGLTNGGARLYTVGCRYELDGTPVTDRALHASNFDGAAAVFVDQLPLTNYDDAYALDGDTVLLGLRENAPKPSRIEAWQLDTAGKFQLASTNPTADPGTLAVVHGLLVAGSSGVRHLYDVTDAAHFRDLGEFENVTPYWYGSDLRKADGSPTRGLWEPLGNYGVNFIKFAP